MSNLDEITRPLLFNPWKHHMGFLLDRIIAIAKSKHYTSLERNLKKIGQSTTDLYTGNIPVPGIADFSLHYLESLGLLGEKEYLDWINSSAEFYRELTFPDRSVWIFRQGNDPGRHVHIHPGRNVPHTMRVKANVLKTAIASTAISLVRDVPPLHIDTINQVRREFLDLSPVKHVTMNHELGRVICLFAEQLNITD